MCERPEHFDNRPDDNFPGGRAPRCGGPRRMPMEGPGERPGAPRRMPGGPGPRFGGPDPRFGGPRPMPFFGEEHPAFPRPDSLMGLFIRSHRAMERRPAEHRGSGRVLRLLEVAGGSLSQHELLELTDIRPGSLSELLGKMEAKGLIARETQEDDRRKVTVTLTDAGRESLSERGRHRDPFAVLSEEEREQLRGLLEKLVNTWEGSRI